MPFNIRQLVTSAALVLLLAIMGDSAFAQPVTGVWQGVLVKQQGFQQRRTLLEVKLIARGDSILGTAYYFRNQKEYIRYALRGYFGREENTVHWQDMAMVENTLPPNLLLDWYREGLKADAAFSCPDGKMPLLDGSVSMPDGEQYKLKLAKGNKALFEDEWMPIIDEYFTGGNQPELIDSLYLAQARPSKAPRPQPAADDIAKASLEQKENIETVGSKETTTTRESTARPPTKIAATPNKENVVVAKPTTNTGNPPQKKPIPPPVQATVKSTATTNTNVPVRVLPMPASASTDTLKAVVVTTSKTNPNASGEAFREEKAKAVGTGLAPAPVAASDTAILVAYKQRTREIQTEIEVSGDSLELRFYDNAEVDGDSISLFLDGRMLFQHVKLQASPYIYKLATDQLANEAELTMVAENLGAIPPNTAFMEAFTNGTRFTARLVSTESSSGVIRLIRKRE